MSKREAKKIAQQYAQVLKKHHIQFSDMYLFGSYANGNPLLESDIDIALVVNRVRSRKDYMDTKMRLWEIALEVDSRIEPILLEKKDFGKDATTMAYQIQKTGIRI